VGGALAHQRVDVTAERLVGGDHQPRRREVARAGETEPGAAQQAPHRRAGAGGRAQADACLGAGREPPSRVLAELRLGRPTTRWVARAVGARLAALEHQSGGPQRAQRRAGLRLLIGDEKVAEERAHGGKVRQDHPPRRVEAHLEVIPVAAYDVHARPPAQPLGEWLSHAGSVTHPASRPCESSTGGGQGDGGTPEGVPPS
jgi:hypothetical protein